MTTSAQTSPTKPKRPAKSTRCRRAVIVPAWHAGYLKLLPDIYRLARIRTIHLRGEARSDAFQEIVADTVVAYARLAELGRENLAFATPLVEYAAAKFRAGRRVGVCLNINDVSSEYCRRRRGVTIERLRHSDVDADGWEAVVVEDRRATPADVAATRIDFREWLMSLPTRTREIARLLATGESTSAVARACGVSSGRISQLRTSLRDGWYAFVDPSNETLAHS
jgi:DNA-directed RNA polymerase specialized sigma24 family protein